MLIKGNIDIQHETRPSTDPNEKRFLFTVPVIKNNKELPFTEIEAFGQIFTLRIESLENLYTIYLDDFPLNLLNYIFTASSTYMKRANVLSRDSTENKNIPFICAKHRHLAKCYVNFDLSSKSAATFDLQISIKKPQSKYCKNIK